MFNVQCNHTIKMKDTQGVEYDFGVGDFIKLFVENEPAFSRTQAALFAGVRIAAKPLMIESADMVELRTAVANPTKGFFLQPQLEAAPFVRAIVDAKES